jgi:hypothetical protein
MPQYLTPFSDSQLLAARIEVARLVRSLQGRKLEEGDWTELYCRVKGTPFSGWSNLPFRDYIDKGLGVEFKLLQRGAPHSDIGRSLMHPAATRTISFNPSEPAETAMNAVLSQWGAQIRAFEERIADSSPNRACDARWGILLWAPDHSEFLYFEERLQPPNPNDFTAKWISGQHRGNATRNLHIFERATGKKRFSCTLPTHGAKLQPYFDVPTVKQGAVIFRPPPHSVVPFYVNTDDSSRAREMFPEQEDEEIMSKLLAFYLEHGVKPK